MPNIPVFQLDRISPALEAALGETMLRLRREEAAAKEKPHQSQPPHTVMLPCGITVAMRDCLRFIRDRSQSTKDLARLRGITLESQSTMCANLVRKGYASRHIIPVGKTRHSIFTITPKGQDMLAQAEKEA